nr:hypothetical protein [uncultured Eubacterium sp.]
MNITYTEISDIVTYMKSIIELLCVDRISGRRFRRAGNRRFE